MSTGAGSALLLDDEPNVLSSLRRTLVRAGFEITTTEDPLEALRTIRRGDHDVVVTDHRMPKLTGVEVLRRARMLAPDTMRVMLTGYADAETATAAINDGSVDRLLIKPCPAEVLTGVLSEVVQVRRDRLAARELIDRAREGATRSLRAVLAAASPTLAARSERLSGIAATLCSAAGMAAPRIPLAAEMSQLGLLGLPDALVDRLLSGTSLSEGDGDALSGVGHRAAGILRPAAGVEELIALLEQVRWPNPTPRTDAGPVVVHVAMQLEHLSSRGMSLPQAASQVAKEQPDDIADVLRQVGAEVDRVADRVPVAQLAPDMELAVNVISRDGQLLGAHGLVLHDGMIDLLVRMHDSGLIEPTVLVHR